MTAKTDRSGVRMLSIVLIALFAFASVGCVNIDEARELVNRSEQGLAVARQQLAEAHRHIDGLRTQVDEYAGIVSEIGGERGAELVEQLRGRLDQAESAIPALQNAVAMAEQGAQEARRGLSLAEKQATAGEWIKWGLGALAGLLGGGAGIAIRGANRTRVALSSAVALADRLKPIAEQHDPKGVETYVRHAKVEQDRAGVRHIVRREMVK